MADGLLGNVNLSSSHLFRADVVFDMTGIVKINREKEDYCCVEPPDLNLDYRTDEIKVHGEVEARAVLPFEGV